MEIQVTKVLQMFDKDVIEKYGNSTGWFDVDRPLSRPAMYNTLMVNMGFSREQALVTIASLGLVGVVFTDETIMIDE